MWMTGVVGWWGWNKADFSQKKSLRGKFDEFVEQTWKWNKIFLKINFFTNLRIIKVK